MLPIAAIAASMLTVITLPAQGRSPEREDGFAVIKGHVNNSADLFWEFGKTGYLNNDIVSVPIDKNGDFIKEFKLEGNVQDLYLYLNDDAITIYAQKNDTIEINWDAKNFNKTFSVKSVAPDRNRDLQTMLTLYRLYRTAFGDLQESLYKDKAADSIKFIKINDLYNKEIGTLLEGGVDSGTRKMATDIYFQFARQLFFQHLLPAYDLFLQHPSEQSRLIPMLGLKKLYRRESEQAFKNSSNYRDFLFDYVRFYNLNGEADALRMLEGEHVPESRRVPFSACWNDYYSGLRSFKIYEMRDWFITKSIMFDFESYSFDDASAVCRDFIPKATVSYYADTLKAYYTAVQRLKPGNPAPLFTLNGVNGGSVALKDLRGKVVYIDFWGVGCGPCVYDIKNSVPILHEKYKDKNIVFLNICVDANERDWKENIAKLKLTGINLIAEGWGKNPVCRAYGINGIPHYYIIDTDGNIVDNNSPRPSEEQLYPILDKLINK